MRAHEGRVDHGVFVVGVDRQVLEHPLPYAGLGPATEAGLHRDPTAEPLGHIAPGNARPIAVERRPHEEPDIRGGPAPTKSRLSLGVTPTCPTRPRIRSWIRAH